MDHAVRWTMQTLANPALWDRICRKALDNPAFLARFYKKEQPLQSENPAKPWNIQQFEMDPAWGPQEYISTSQKPFRATSLMFGHWQAVHLRYAGCWGSAVLLISNEDSFIATSMVFGDLWVSDLSSCKHSHNETWASKLRLVLDLGSWSSVTMLTMSCRMSLILTSSWGSWSSALIMSCWKLGPYRQSSAMTTKDPTRSCTCVNTQSLCEWQVKR